MNKRHPRPAKEADENAIVVVVKKDRAHGTHMALIAVILIAGAFWIFWQRSPAEAGGVTTVPRMVDAGKEKVPKRSTSSVADSLPAEITPAVSQPKVGPFGSTAATFFEPTEDKESAAE